jgi:ketosteroid isomerase-like protein
LATLSLQRNVETIVRIVVSAASGFRPPHCTAVKTPPGHRALSPWPSRSLTSVKSPPIVTHRKFGQDTTFDKTLHSFHQPATIKMTLKQISLLIITISLTTFLQAQQLLTKDQQEVLQTVTRFFDALSNRDSVSLKNYCAADIVLFENGSIWNVDTLIFKAITQNTAIDFKRVNRIDFINTTVNGNTAWASYNLHSEITRNDKQATVQWMETVVAVKEGKKWKIKVLHSTLIKRN